MYEASIVLLFFFHCLAILRLFCFVPLQLTAQVERLTQQLAQQQLEGAEARTPTRTPQHSPENDTLKEEDSALVAMLQSDLERISAERWAVQTDCFTMPNVLAKCKMQAKFLHTN